MSYTVKAVADVAGVSVRTLHHYDEIGLLKPEGVSASGYRLYSDADLERLQQILFFRELGFELKEIMSILDSPGYDRRQALISHKQLLVEKRKRIEGLIDSIESTIDALERGSKMNNEEMFGAFDESKMEEYKKEAKERWGHTDAYKESERRTSRYTKADWDEIFAESEDITIKIAELMDAGGSPSDEAVHEQVGRWFKHINDRFYTCSLEIFRCLGSGYVDDQRFADFYEKVRPGLAVFMRDSMHAYCDKMERQI